MANSGLFHGTAQFFPWHRLYLRFYEDALRQVSGNPTMSVPYWDWTLDASAPASSLILSPNYFGGAGVAPDYCVTTGVAKNWAVVYPFQSSCVSRCSSWTALYPPTTVNQILTRSATYGSFRHDLEAIPHALIHTSGGGSCTDSKGNAMPFSNMASPNDPFFFIHHANVDRLWYRWQDMCPGNGALYDEPGVALTDLLTSWNVPVSQAMDISNPRLCYTYSASSTDLVGFTPTCKSGPAGGNSTVPPPPVPTAPNPAAYWFNNLLLSLVPNAVPASLPNVNKGSVSISSVPAPRPLASVVMPSPGPFAPIHVGVNAPQNTMIPRSAIHKRGLGSAAPTGSPNAPIQDLVDITVSLSSSNPSGPIKITMYHPPPNTTVYTPASYVKIQAPSCEDRTDMVNLRFPPSVPESYLIMHGLDVQRARAGEVESRHVIDYYNNLDGFVSPVCLGYVYENTNGYWRPTHQQLVERQPEFRKASAAAWLALKRETLVPAHSAPKVELSSGFRLIYASGFPYAKPGDLRKAMQGARIRTSAVRDIRWISRQVVQLLVDADYVSAFTRIITSLNAAIVKSFKAWIPRSEAADKDKLAAILSFAAKTVTTIQRSPDVKARNFFRLLLASIGGKTLEAATAEATKICSQTPDFSISTLETVPKESLPVKKATEKEPAAPAVDPPSDMAAEVTPAIQIDGVAPTVTPIADVEMCL
ncbi:hypothetical protein BASA81_015023 [Batrachochytrium salamandrivorans]|nr:hypothetical protein BASA81_015023 [Batrachochytrium salamandrivorans]